MDPRWDIFCKVVDNFGDAGVAWRLARVLAREHALPVRLWIDDPRSLARIAPGVDAARDAQCVDGDRHPRVARQRGPLPTPAGVVVEAFGCGLPDAYVAAMAETPAPPVWFVLEYLSAEPWIDGAHGLPSPHPRLALSRRYWFPGFTAESGGLLRERGLFQARDAFAREPGARAAFWSSLSVPAPSSAECRVSLFCYPNPALPALLDAWADGDDPVSCVIPDGVAVGALDAWTAGNMPHAGRPYARGRVRAARDSVPLAGRLRPAALGMRRQFRARRGFVRPRAMGGTSVRVAHLPASRGRASAQARRLRRALRGGAGYGVGGGGTADVPRLERRRRRRRDWRCLGRVSRPEGSRSSGTAAPGRRSWPLCRSSPQDWSRLPPIGYN